MKTNVFKRALICWISIIAVSSQFFVSANWPLSHVEYSTYLGWSGAEDPAWLERGGIARDSAWNIYVIGQTQSNDYPVTAGAYGTWYNDPAANALLGDCVISKFDPTFTELLASTYFGGSAAERCTDIEIDAADNVYIAISTQSSTLPTTVDSYDQTMNNRDVYLAKFDSDLSTVLNSTYFGWSWLEVWWADLEIAWDGSIYVWFYSTSSDVPTAWTPFQTNQWSLDNVVAHFDSDLTTLIHSTYLWWSGNERQNVALGIANNGDIMISTHSASTDFPVPGWAYSTTNAWEEDIVIAILDPTLATLEAATYFGWSNFDHEQFYGWDIIQDAAWDIYIVWSTRSSDFPITSWAYDSTFDLSEWYIARFDEWLTTLKASTFIWGVWTDVLGSLEFTPNWDLVFLWFTDGDLTPSIDAFDDTSNGIDHVIWLISSDLSTVSQLSFVWWNNTDLSREVAESIIVDGECVYIAWGTESFDSTFFDGNDTSSGYPLSTWSWDIPYQGNTGGGIDIGLTKLCPASCGDNVVQDFLGEECDDENLISWDGCSAACKIEIVNAVNPWWVSNNLALRLHAWTWTDTIVQWEDVNIWEDLSPSGFDASSWANSHRPLYEENALNYNPSLTFPEGDNDIWFNLWSNYIFSPNENWWMHIFTAALPTKSNNRKAIVDFGSYIANNYGLYMSTNQLALAERWYSTLWTPTNNTTAIGEAHYDFVADRKYLARSWNESSWNQLHWGQLTAAEINEAPTHQATSWPVSIGRASKNNDLDDDSWRRFFGDLWEVIMYNWLLTDAEIFKVRSYLALKYWVELWGNQNYFASDDSLMWDLWVDSTYQLNVFGIWRDDDSGLDQKISTSVNLGTIVTVSLDDDFIIPDNDVTRTTAHTNDLQFLTISNNFGIIGNSNFEIDLSIYSSRIPRERLVQKKDFTDSVSLKFDWLDSTYALLVDVDGNFSTTADQTNLWNLDTNGEISWIDFADNIYFTLAIPKCSEWTWVLNNNECEDWSNCDANGDADCASWLCIDSISWENVCAGTPVDCSIGSWVENSNECIDGANCENNGAVDCASGICDITEPSAVCESSEMCGNSVLETTEGCDDGNTMSWDGCDANCLIEDLFECNDDMQGETWWFGCVSGICDETESPSVCEPVDMCGNSELEANEWCDDGNTIAGDGCSELCLIENWNTCNQGSEWLTDNGSCESQFCDPAGGWDWTCGDAPIACSIWTGVENNNECIDGASCDNNGDADCASWLCIDSISWENVCAGTPVDCSIGSWVENNNECIDGASCENNGAVDCASDICDITEPSAVCESSETCGNSVLEDREACDDGNNLDGDGCSAFCRIEDTYLCVGHTQCASGICDQTVNPGVCEPADICGNSIVESWEWCDDGNIESEDGCNESCLIEDTQECSYNAVWETSNNSCESGLCDESGGVPGACEPVNTCGNGVLEAGEGCDDGNILGLDGCNVLCQLENGEECNVDTNWLVGAASCVSGLCDTTWGAPGICEETGVCWNSELDSFEWCDDGNTDSNDGCSDVCLIENDGICNESGVWLVWAESCESGICDITGTDNACEPADTCGNNVLEGTEVCDDGNTAAWDGCNTLCKIENTYECVWDTDCASSNCDETETPSVCEPQLVCGNGTLEIGEGCDDGNAIAGDGCNASCEIENGEVCNYNAVWETSNNSCESGLCNESWGTPGACEPVNTCGNGTLETGEGCDDGNTTAWDGCNAMCEIENEIACNVDAAGEVGSDSCESGLCDESWGAPGICEPTSTCGNGTLETGEGCDDGNTIAGDGCNASCEIENGEVCNYNAVWETSNNSCEGGICDETWGAPGTCEPANTCGNGILESWEWCDDGNTDPNDECSATCLVEIDEECNTDTNGAVGWLWCQAGICNTTWGAPWVCELGGVCGNSVLEDREGCDDGNNIDGDGCSSLCRIEDTYLCNQGPVGYTLDQSCESGVCDETEINNVCEPANTCGNSVIEGSEVCDDGNTENGDGCSSACLFEDGEECDANVACQSGNCDTTETPSVCEPADTCGNGILEWGEWCDDGNTIAGDGCSVVCLIEIGDSCNTIAPWEIGAASCETEICDVIWWDSGVCEPSLACGNSVLETNEWCDDGNTEDGDGCSNTCLIENTNVCNMNVAGEVWPASCASGICDSSGNTDVCEPVGACGNNVIELGEACDDGDTVNGDGCSDQCLLEDTISCDWDNQCQSGICDLTEVDPVCEPINTCGNSVLETGEACDDGNLINGDGCSSICEVEDGGSDDSGSTDGGSDDSGSTDGGSADGWSTDGGTDGGEVSEDNDWIPKEEEEWWPLWDDVNNDGIADGYQWNVISAINWFTQRYATTIIESDTCSPSDSSIQYYAEKDFAAADEEFDYEQWFHGFETSCVEPWSDVTITYYRDDMYDTSSWNYRKYLFYSDQYIDFNDQVSYSTQTVNWKEVTVVTYSITDWWIYDSDGIADGVIIDPIGPWTQMAVIPEINRKEKRWWWRTIINESKDESESRNLEFENNNNDESNFLEEEILNEEEFTVEELLIVEEIRIEKENSKLFDSASNIDDAVRWLSPLKLPLILPKTWWSVSSINNN